MDLTEALKGLAAVQSLLPALQAQLKERAVQEAVAGGAAVIVRPEFFPRPVRAQKGCPGHVDPWFGLTQMDWNAEIRAGFSGWFETTEGSGKPKVMINYDAARVWLGQKMERQQKNREEAA
jgi:hypothetical protein